MFNKKESISPEEKLLRMIEQPQGGGKVNPVSSFSQKGTGNAKKSNLIAGLKKLNFLDLLNWFLLAVAAITTVFLLLTVFEPTKPAGLEISKHHGLNLSTPITAEVLKTKLSPYLDTILKRNVFGVSQRGEDLRESEKEKIDLKLVGIISLGNNQQQAIIEDKNSRTHLINEGDMLLGKLNVLEIGPDKVVFKKAGEIIELK